MEDFKTMLDKGMSIVEIDNAINQFFVSIDGYSDQLKLTYVLLHLIQEGSRLLRSIDAKDFISQMKERINEVEEQSKTLFKEYNALFLQNKEIVEVLLNGNGKQASGINNEIKELLSKYDLIIKELVRTKESLPIEKQLEQEKNYQ